MNRLASLRLLLLVLPIACVGLFGRGYFTPDEPREASLVVAMASQAQWALPELAGRPFAEKPPLLYWLGGASVSAFGATPAAARAPNLLYFLVTALALAALAGRAAGPAAGFAAGFVAVTALQIYQVLIWLATDAPLVAGTALALLGGYTALTTEIPRTRLLGYGGFYAGLALAFFAKGFAGWLVPVPAFLGVIVLERRWRELARAELWLGTLLLIVAIGSWVYCVDLLPEGRESLKVVFWYNLVGRALPLAAPPGYAYAAGHQNSFGKYFLELPLYLLPWVAVAFAALRRGLGGWRDPGPTGTAWRLAFGAVVPATILLSLAATARGVYYGPVALAFALLIGLEVGTASVAPDRIERACWRLTAWLIAALALALGTTAGLVCFAPATRDTNAVLLGAVAIAAAVAATGIALSARASAAAMPRYALAVAIVLTLVIGPVYRALNGWQDLEAPARRVSAAAGPGPLFLLDADETTLAMASLYLPPGRGRLALSSSSPAAIADARAALATAGEAARVLWLVPDRANWGSAGWLAFLGYRPALVAVPAPALVPPAGLGALRIVCRVVRPGGRTFALLAAGTATGEAAAPRSCP